MGYELNLRFGPIFTSDRLADQEWEPDRTMYERGACRFLPSQSSVPLLIDHRADQVIGAVHMLWPIEWHGGPWQCASATVEHPPSWLKRGTKCSVSHQALIRRKIEPWLGRAKDVIHSTLVKEISVLSPGVDPAEPCAEVLTFGPAKTATTRSSPARSSTSAAAGEEVIYHDHAYAGGVLKRRASKDEAEMEEFRRRLDWAERHQGRADFELIHKNLLIELGHESALDRHYREHLARVRGVAA